MEQPNHPLNQIEHLNLDPHILKLSYHQHIDHSLLNNQHEEVAHRNQGDALNEIDHNQQEQPLINKQCVIPEPQASRQEQRPQEFIREPSNSSEPTETKDQLKSAVEKILNFETQLNPIQPETQLNPIQPETQLNPIQSGERKILHERDNRKDTQSSQSVLQSSEIILPINRFLFPESEQSLVFHPNQLQYIDRIRQESQNSPNHPLSHLVVSVGKIPPAPGTSAGQPFDDGFTCIIPQSPPPHTEIYHQPINCDESNQPDPNLLPSSNLPSRRVGRPRKSIPNYNDSRSYTQSRRSNPQKSELHVGEAGARHRLGGEAAVGPGIRDRAAAGEGEPRGHGQDRGGAPGEGDAERRRVPGHPVRVHGDPRREPGAPDAPGRRRPISIPQESQRSPLDILPYGELNTMVANSVPMHVCLWTLFTRKHCWSGWYHHNWTFHEYWSTANRTSKKNSVAGLPQLSIKARFSLPFFFFFSFLIVTMSDSLSPSHHPLVYSISTDYAPTNSFDEDGDSYTSFGSLQTPPRLREAICHLFDGGFPTLLATLSNLPSSGPGSPLEPVSSHVPNSVIGDNLWEVSSLLGETLGDCRDHLQVAAALPVYPPLPEIDGHPWSEQDEQYKLKDTIVSKPLTPGSAGFSFNLGSSGQTDLPVANNVFNQIWNSHIKDSFRSWPDPSNGININPSLTTGMTATAKPSPPGLASPSAAGNDVATLISSWPSFADHSSDVTYLPPKPTKKRLRVKRSNRAPTNGVTKP